MSLWEKLTAALTVNTRNLEAQILGPVTKLPSFALRVHAAGDAVSLGTSIETAELRLHRSPFVATGGELYDDHDRIVVVPAGQRFVVRAFDGAVRRAVGTEATGTVLTYEVAAGAPFWIVDAPAWDGCLETGDPQRRQLPPRVEPYELTTRDPPSGERDIDTMGLATTADLVTPNCAIGLEHPERWLLGPRDSDQPMVCIATLATRGGCMRSTQHDYAALYLMDAVWRETTARAVAGAPWCGDAPRSFDDLAGWRPRFPADAVFVWGVAEGDHDRVRMFVQRGSETTARTLSGTLDDVRPQLIAELVSRGVARRAAATSVCVPIAALPAAEGTHLMFGAKSILYSRHLWEADRSDLSRYGLISADHYIGMTRELAKDGATLARLVWITTAIQAHAADALDPEQRAAVLAMARRATGADPVHRILPGVLLGLGMASDAATACTAALAECWEDPAWLAYREWLERVQAKATAAQ